MTTYSVQSLVNRVKHDFYQGCLFPTVPEAYASHETVKAATRHAGIGVDLIDAGTPQAMWRFYRKPSSVTERFEKMVHDHMKPTEDLMKDITPEKVRILHGAVGISGEGGEILEMVKKWVFANKPLDKAKIMREIGDVEFYLEDLRQQFGWTRDEVLEALHAKLSARYPTGKYTDEHAQKHLDERAENEV